MRRILLTWLLTLVLGLSLFSPGAYAQPGRAPNPGEETSERGAPALQYTVAFFITVLIMLILCMPSRKRQAPSS